MNWKKECFNKKHLLGFIQPSFKPVEIFGLNMLVQARNLPTQ